MAMTKKHHKAFAEAINHTAKRYGPDERKALRALALQFTSIFKADNSSFDASRFLDACGLYEKLESPEDMAAQIDR